MPVARLEIPEEMAKAIVQGRATLECDWCGYVAVVGEVGNMFSEDMADACLSCGFPGFVSIDDADDDNVTASWVTRDDDSAIIARWREEHPEAAADMDAEEAEWQRRGLGDE